MGEGEEKEDVRTTGADAQDKAKVNVDDMAFLINHNVAVVPVLEGQEVGKEGVPGEGLGKVLLRGLEFHRAGAAVDLLEVASQGALGWLGG